MAEVGEEVSKRGWYVKVYAADRGYDDPRQAYPRYEYSKGMHIRRLRWSSFGKRSIPLRLAGQLSFVVQTFLRGVFSRRLDAVLVTTSPPMGAVVAWAITFFRRAPMHFWVMDMNPDQAVELGAFDRRHWLVKIFDGFLKRMLRRSKSVIALDAFMAKRLIAKVAGVDTMEKGWEERAEANESVKSGGLEVLVVPPWPMESLLAPVAHHENPFRKEHHLDGKRVLAYSGNHSLAHPIETFLLAAGKLGREAEVRFLFIGGGKRKGEVDAAAREGGVTSLVSLPYQPMEKIRYSLSAADVHLISVGDAMVGCVHPCKFYSALALGKPILLLGPRRSHVGEILAEYPIGWQVDHGDVARMVEVYSEILDCSMENLRARGLVALEVLRTRFSEAALRDQFVDGILRS